MDLIKPVVDVVDDKQLFDATPEAEKFIKGLLERNLDLEEMFMAIQPLLAAMSEKLYKEDASDKSLSTLVNDAVVFLQGV